MSPPSLSGRRALVTGASRGLGRLLAQTLAAHGAAVFAVARGEDGLRETQRLIRDAGGSCDYAAVDLAADDGPATAVDAAAGALGGLDVLVNNAAVSQDAIPAVDLDAASWDAILGLGLRSAFLMCQESAPHLFAGGGKVINVTSILSTVGVANSAAYVACKHGLLGLTRALALEWAGNNVQVNALAPGFTKTDMTERLWANDAGADWVVARTPMRRWGTAQDAAGAITFLASSASDFVTGQSLFVDGGWTAQ